MTDASEAHIQRIRQHHPDLEMLTVRRVNVGQNNDVFVVNDEWVFRFARHEASARTLATEVAVLRALHEASLPLQIPFPRYVHLDSDGAVLPYMGYRSIPGTPLTRAWATSVATEPELRTLARDLANFLQAMHRWSPPHNVEDRLLRHDPADHWSGVFERIQRLLFPHMREDSKRDIQDRFERFLHGVEGEQLPLCVIHGDCGASNLLIREAEASLVGVIDFGSVCLGDPAVDYAASSTIHPRMLEWMEASCPKIQQYAERIAFYRSTFALQEALFGLETGDAVAFECGMALYR